MSYRFDVSLITDSYHFGNRGLGVIGSFISSTGVSGPGYVYNDLSLPADADKEYIGFIVTPPATGQFFAFEDTSFEYTGPSTTFTYKLYEDGVDLGNQTVTLNMGGIDSSASWTEASDINNNEVIITIATTLNWSEETDSTSIVGNVGTSSSGSVSWSEDVDTSNISVSLAVQVGVVDVEVDDYFNMSGVLGPIDIEVLWSEDNDTHIVVINLPIQQTVNWLEDNDTYYILVNLPGAASPLPTSLRIKFKNPRYKITFKRE